MLINVFVAEKMDAKGKGKMVRVEPEVSDVEPEISDDSFERMLSEANDYFARKKMDSSGCSYEVQSNSIGIQKTSPQDSNSSTRSNVEQTHRNGRIASGPHTHPRDSDFVFLDPSSSCGWC